MKKKNILHLVEYLYLGGIERLLEQLAVNSQDKVNLHFFTYETVELKGIGKTISDKGFPVYTYKKKAGRDWQLIDELIKIIKEKKIDVLHTHDFGPVEYAVILKMRFPKLKLVHTQHTIIHFIRHKKYTRFFQFASHFYNKIIGVSEFVKQTLLDYCPLMKKRALIVIPNGVDTDFFDPKNAVKKSADVKLSLVSVARISPEKNLAYILNTCRLLKLEGIPFTFHHAGTSKKIEDTVKWEEYIKEHNLTNEVYLHGFTEDIKGILDYGDIFVNASKTEGHPVAVLEAMSYEKLCFCSDIAPHRELTRDAIKFFDINDEKNLLDQLRNYHNSDNFLPLKNSMGKLARQEVLARFSIAKMVNSYVEQY
ncbi:MAG: glycosyltransferase family 4 protein [Bacteriovoracaceae bacterium]